jgi:hypothetical protein
LQEAEGIASAAQALQQTGFISSALQNSLQQTGSVSSSFCDDVIGLKGGRREGGENQFYCPH